MLRIVVAVGLLGGCTQDWKPTPASDKQASAGASVFDRPWIWLDDSGTRVELSRWRGTPLVVAAVFTTCQETCPITLTKLRKIYDQFTREHRRAEFIVVTIDPETDTPSQLRELRRSRHLPDAWHLLTGGTDEINQLADMLGIHIMTMDTGMDQSHMVHDSKIVMFDGNGRSVSEVDVL